jgi:hypothetical protein
VSTAQPGVQPIDDHLKTSHGALIMSADAWVLLSILYSENETESGASLTAIISTADYINHAILLYEELNESLARLRAAGHIEEHAGKYRATERARSAYLKFTKPRRAVWKDFKDVEQYLSSFTDQTEQPALPTAIERTEFEAAVKTYLQRMQSGTTKRTAQK